MNGDDTEDDTIYKVVVNHEEQYSIWPTGRTRLAGGMQAKAARKPNA
jgi:MbtH protein